MNKIGLDEKFALFSEYWRPKTIAALNGQEVKLVKVRGEFPWHHHKPERTRPPDAARHHDALSGLERDDPVAKLDAEPASPVEHRTCADEEAAILCFEPAGTINTGNVNESAYSAQQEVI